MQLTVSSSPHHSENSRFICGPTGTNGLEFIISASNVHRVSLSSFLAFVENQAFDLGDGQLPVGCSQTEGWPVNSGNFPTRSGLKIGYSVKACSISVSYAKSQTLFANA
jgi:hypothetical protein